MLSLFLQYFAFSFVACLGTIQVAVSVSGLRGLWLTPWRWANRLLGGLLIVASAWWFFAREPRAVPYPLLEGSQQGGTFLFAGILATWVTVFLVPGVHRLLAGAVQGTPPETHRGLESLRHGSFWARRGPGARRARG
ncbi:MAG: hypothetical protein FJ315_03460 [SAR202 cluster bacterium]|nr:hypothetical protein [SAR202 cluster bacterium]